MLAVHGMMSVRHALSVGIQLDMARHLHFECNPASVPAYHVQLFFPLPLTSPENPPAMHIELEIGIPHNDSNLVFHSATILQSQKYIDGDCILAVNTFRL